MLSLRGFHFFFILLAIVGADLFGAWAIWHYPQTHNAWVLALGILSLAGGFGLIAYAIWFVRKLDRAHIA